MIDRKIDAYFDRFFKRTKKAVLVTGARQIGKTYSIRAAARRNFDYFVEVNFITSPEAVGIFRGARDAQDMNREVDPLRPTEDAVIVDSTDMTFEQVVDHILAIVEEKSHA